MSDNIHLSDIQSTRKRAHDPVAFYLRAARSENTHRAYASDLSAFRKAGGSIPASPEMIAMYLADQAGSLAVSTLRRRLAAIAWAHRDCNHSDPTKSRLVRDTLRGIERHHGAKQKQAKPLLYEHLISICGSLGDTSRDRRDRAALLVGFFAALRGSELVSLRIEDTKLSATCLELTIRQSKTDQEKRGRRIAVPRLGGPICPVAAFCSWATIHNRTFGWVFPAGGNCCNTPSHLSVRQLSRLVRSRSVAIGCSGDGYSSHSLRSGFVTWAGSAGMTPLQVASQSGHADLSSTHAYMRADRFSISQQISDAVNTCK